MIKRILIYIILVIFSYTFLIIYNPYLANDIWKKIWLQKYNDWIILIKEKYNKFVDRIPSKNEVTDQYDWAKTKFKEWIDSTHDKIDSIRDQLNKIEKWYESFQNAYEKSQDIIEKNNETLKEMKNIINKTSSWANSLIWSWNINIDTEVNTNTWIINTK